MRFINGTPCCKNAGKWGGKSLPGQAGSDLDAEWQELVREFA